MFDQYAGSRPDININNLNNLKTFKLIKQQQSIQQQKHPIINQQQELIQEDNLESNINDYLDLIYGYFVSEYYISQNAFNLNKFADQNEDMKTNNFLEYVKSLYNNQLYIPSNGVMNNLDIEIFCSYIVCKFLIEYEYRINNINDIKIMISRINLKDFYDIIVIKNIDENINIIINKEGLSKGLKKKINKFLNDNKINTIEDYNQKIEKIKGELDYENKLLIYIEYENNKNIIDEINNKLSSCFNKIKDLRENDEFIKNIDDNFNRYYKNNYNNNEVCDELDKLLEYLNDNKEQLDEEQKENIPDSYINFKREYENNYEKDFFYILLSLLWYKLDDENGLELYYNSICQNFREFGIELELQTNNDYKHIYNYINENMNNINLNITMKVRYNNNEYSDCGETSLRNFFKILLFNNNILDISILENILKHFNENYQETLIYEYFSTYDTLEKHNDNYVTEFDNYFSGLNARDAWLRIVSEIDGVSYQIKDKYEIGNNENLYGNQNMLKIVKHLLNIQQENFNWTSFNDLDFLSINFEILEDKGDDYNTVKISYKNENIPYYYLWYFEETHFKIEIFNSKYYKLNKFLDNDELVYDYTDFDFQYDNRNNNFITENIDNKLNNIQNEKYRDLVIILIINDISKNIYINLNKSINDFFINLLIEILKKIKYFKNFYYYIYYFYVYQLEILDYNNLICAHMDYILEIIKNDNYFNIHYEDYTYLLNYYFCTYKCIRDNNCKREHDRKIYDIQFLQELHNIINPTNSVFKYYDDLLQEYYDDLLQELDNISNPRNSVLKYSNVLRELDNISNPINSDFKYYYSYILFYKNEVNEYIQKKYRDLENPAIRNPSDLKYTNPKDLDIINISYFKKYLKYKSKYLKLKNKI